MPNHEKRALAGARSRVLTTINDCTKDTTVGAPLAPFASLSPFDQAFRHLISLYPHGFDRGEWLELRTLDCARKPARPGPRLYFRSVTDLANAAVDLREQWDCFFGVGLRRCPATNRIVDCPHTEIGRDHISRLPSAWGDFDLAEHDHGAEDVLARLQASDLMPETIVASGRGIHGYYPLVNPTTDLARIERLNRSIRDRLGGDNVVDAVRILRIAGTTNRKYNPPLPVQLLAVA